MCKHILNAQVSVRAPCCRKFFDCPACHADFASSSDGHALRPTTELAMLCKKCRRAFRVDLERAEEADNYCPHCDNCYVIEAKTPAPMLGIEGEDARMDNRMLKDDRLYDPRRDFQARERAAQESERLDAGGVAAALQQRAREVGRPEIEGLDGGGAGGAQGVQGVGGINDEELDWSM